MKKNRFRFFLWVSVFATSTVFAVQPQSAVDKAKFTIEDKSNSASLETGTSTASAKLLFARPVEGVGELKLLGKAGADSAGKPLSADQVIMPGDKFTWVLDYQNVSDKYPVTTVLKETYGPDQKLVDVTRKVGGSSSSVSNSRPDGQSVAVNMQNVPPGEKGQIVLHMVYEPVVSQQQAAQSQQRKGGKPIGENGERIYNKTLSRKYLPDYLLVPVFLLFFGFSLKNLYNHKN